MPPDPARQDNARPDPSRQGRTVLRVLAAISVILAVNAAVLAVMWKRQHDQLACYQAYADMGLKAGRDCAD